MFVKSLYLFAAFSLAKKAPCNKSDPNLKGIPHDPKDPNNYVHNKSYHDKSDKTVASLDDMANSIVQASRDRSRNILKRAKQLCKQLIEAAHKDAAALRDKAQWMDWTNELAVHMQKDYDTKMENAEKTAQVHAKMIANLAKEADKEEKAHAAMLKARAENFAAFKSNNEDYPAVHKRGEVMVRDEGSALVLRGPEDMDKEMMMNKVKPLIGLGLGFIIGQLVAMWFNFWSFILGGDKCEDEKESVKICAAKCPEGTTRQVDGSCKAPTKKLR